MSWCVQWSLEVNIIVSWFVIGCPEVLLGCLGVSLDDLRYKLGCLKVSKGVLRYVLGYLRVS